jgi:hypothetical protein
MKPKQFIEAVFLTDLSGIIDRPYIAFAIMGTGIEFLGKCLDLSAAHWNVSGRSKKNFEDAINTLNSFKAYRQFLTSHRLWDSLRNGFNHSFVPKWPLTLSSKGECPHLFISQNDRLNLRCEDFYHDFRNACLEIIEMEFQDPNDKMNRQLLSVPGE